MAEFDEYALFPMDVLRVTQGPGYAVDGVAACTYSHTGQHAYDIAGKDGTKSPVYAPFSCTVKRIYNGNTASSKCNFTWYINTKRVKTLDGVVHQPGNLIFMTAHCNNEEMQKYGIKVGAEFKQGEICGYEGTAGGYSAHCHIMVGKGPWSGTGWFKSVGGNYDINNPLFMHRVFWLRPECVVKGTGGYPWTVLKDATIPDTPETEDRPEHTKPAPDTHDGDKYFPKYTGTTGSIVNALSTLGVDSAYNYRSTIAAANGITGYLGTPAQNVKMLDLLKQGKLVKPESLKYYQKPNYTGVSIAAALSTIGVDSSYAHRAKIAAANNIKNYTGTAAQNTQMLNLLKQGKLIIA